MIPVFIPFAGNGKLLLVKPEDLDEVLQQERGHVASLVTVGLIKKGSACIETVTRKLLRAGCDYFVCFGPDSEQLHDQIDAIVEEGADDPVCMTTWHEEVLRRWPSSSSTLWVQGWTRSWWP